MTASKKFDILVIGGGILGIAHAYHCLKRGLRVALIEQHAWPQQATVRNFGQIVPSGMNRKWQLYGRRSLDLYQEIQREVDITVRQQGSIYLASDAEEMQLLEELAHINREEDYASTLWTQKKCLSTYPELKASYVKGGLFFPEEINLDPRQAARRIIQFCQAKYELAYFPSTRVHELHRQGGEVKARSTSGISFVGKKAIVCGGIETQSLFPEIFAAAELDLVKLQMLELMPQPQVQLPGSILTGWTIRRYESFQECPSYAEIKAREDAEAFHRRWGIHILFKQSPDGSIILGDSHEYEPLLPGTSPSFDQYPEVNDFMIREAKKIVDLPSWEVRRQWLGFYCQSRRSDIFHHIVDEHIHLITGIGGKGMTGSLGYAEVQVDKLFYFPFSP